MAVYDSWENLAFKGKEWNWEVLPVELNERGRKYENIEFRDMLTESGKNCPTSVKFGFNLSETSWCRCGSDLL